MYVSCAGGVRAECSVHSCQYRSPALSHTPYQDVPAKSQAHSPHIQAVLTSDEEIGMLGARDLDTSDLTAKRLINIDSESNEASNLIALVCCL